MGSSHFSAAPWTSSLNPRGFLDYLSVERGASANTIAAYRRDLQRYVVFLRAQGRDDLREVTEADFERYVQVLGEGFDQFLPLGPSSARRCLAAARSWHRYLFETGSLAANVTKDVKTAKLSRRLPEVLSLEEVEALLRGASQPGDSNSLRDRALLEFLYASGARISEAMNLAVDDVDFSSVPAVVRLFGKGRKERLSLLGHEACEALQAYLVRVRPGLAEKGRSEGKVFLNTYGRPMSRQTGWAIIQDAAKRAALRKPVHPHTLRHCFATHLLQGGADIRVVQELLGHASVTTTEIYTKVSQQMLFEVYASAHPRAGLN